MSSDFHPEERTDTDPNPSNTAFLDPDVQVREILESISDGFFSIDRNWRITYINRHAGIQGGRKPEELIGKVLWEEVPVLVGSVLEPVYRRVMEQRQKEEVEFHSQRFDRWYHLRIYPFADGISVYSVDITERKRADEKLRERETQLQQSEQKFRIALSAASIGTWEYDPDTDMVEYDEFAQSLYGVPAGPIVHEHMSRDRMHPDDQPVMFAAVQRACDPAGSGHYESIYRFPQEDGTWRWLRVWGQMQFAGEGTKRQPVKLIGATRDITEQMHANEALKLSEQRLRDSLKNITESEAREKARLALLEAILDALPAYIWIAHDPFASEITGNQAAMKLLSWQQDVVKQKGSVNISYAGKEIHAGQLPIHLAAATGTSIRNAEYEVTFSDGKTHHMLGNAEPFFDEHGNLAGAVSAFIDITERKRTEEALNRYADQLEQVNRELNLANRELKDFAYIASHDLQEPLRKVSKFGEIVRDRYSQEMGEAGTDYLERMIHSANRMQDMIDGLLRYSRIHIQEAKVSKVDLNAVIRDVMADLEIRIEQTNGTIQLQDLPEIEADPLQMRQLFQNLISNGLKFHPPDRDPTIEITVRPFLDKEAGWKSIQVFVKDNGIGFDEMHVNKIFMPFVRLNGRSQYDGTGMGLAICRKIVEHHRGTITAYSKPGEGATFVITLPLKQPEAVNG
jgi:PAS domain S-box-containing protein